MKKILLYVLIIGANYCASAQLGIGTITPDPAAALDINSELNAGARGGLKLPTVANDTERGLINVSATSSGLIIFNQASRCVEMYDAVNANWMDIQCLPPVAQTTVQFETTSTTVEEDNIENVNITIANPSTTTATTLEVNLLPGNTFGVLGVDYDIEYNSSIVTSFPFTVTFPANTSASQVLTIYYYEDADFVNESGVLELQNAAGGNAASIDANSTQTITFNDNDLQTTVQFVNATSSLAEDGVFVEIEVSIANPSSTMATNFEIALDAASTATNGADYDDGQATPSAITFPSSQTFVANSAANVVFTVFISVDDAAVEGDETVILNLQNVSGGTSATLGAITQHTLTIVDNDGVATAPDLFISEYIEGSSSNKYIEIANFTGAAVNLADYRIRLYANGATSASNTEDFSGTGFPATLANGEVIILKNSGASLTIPGNPTTYNSSVCNFNGNDAIELFNDVTVTSIDVFGRIGQDPGTQWNVNNNETADKTLRRNAGVSGNASNTAGFPSLGTEWTEFPQNTVDGLGTHAF